MDTLTSIVPTLVDMVELVIETVFPSYFMVDFPSQIIGECVVCIRCEGLALTWVYASSR